MNVDVSIISVNIRFDNPADKEHDWNGRKPVLKNVLQEFPHDILCTQEGREPQLRDLESLCELKLIDGHREWIKERMYPCIFYNSNKFNLKDSGDIWLSKTPEVPGSKDFDSAFPRLATWAVFEVQKQEFMIVNTHLDHLKNETRLEQIKVLGDFLKTHAHDYLLCGDFNESPEGDVFKFLTTECELTDPWKKPEQTSFHKFSGENENGFRIDWILHSKNFNNSTIEFDERSENKIWPSDHFPVLGKFKL